MADQERRTVDFEHKLKQAGLERWRIAVFSIVSYAPAGAIVVCTPLLMATVGFGSPLMILIGGVVIVLFSTVVAELSRRIPSAGFFYTTNSQIFGTGAGFVTGWVMFLAYGLIPVGGLAYAAFWAQLFVRSYGIELPFWIPFVALGALVFTLTYWGIRPTINFDATVLFVEIGVLGALAITALVLFQAPAPVSTAEMFGSAAFTPGAQAVAIALVFGAICPYVGFENPTSLAEETPEARTRIPFGVIAGAVFGAVFYALWHWAVVAGYGGVLVPAAAEGGQPIQVLSDGLWGPQFLPVVTFVALYGTMGFVLSFTNVVVRALYAMGREGLIPKAFGRTHPKLQTPTTAIVFQMSFVAALGLPLGIAVGGDFTWFYLSYMAFLGFLLIYASITLGLPKLMRQRYPSEFNVLRHGVIPAVVIGIMLLTVVLNVYPVPEFPFNILAYLTGIYILLGLVALSVARRRVPEELERAGALLAGMEVEEAPSPTLDAKRS